MSLRRRTCAALAVALLLGGSAAAYAAAAKSYPTGRFEVGGKLVAAAQILDARALPDMTGKPSLMITLAPGIAETIAAGAAPDTPIPVTLDGKPLGASPAGALEVDHVVQVSGDFGDYDAASALARRISGKDPVPDAESDE